MTQRPVNLNSHESKEPDPLPQMYQQPTPAASSGASAWGMGLLIFALLPFVSSIVASVVMLIVGISARKLGGIAAANGRNAANWGLTYLLATVLLVGTHFTLLFTLASESPVESFFPLGIPLTLWGLISIGHLIFSILGLVRANRGTVYAAPAIPWIK